MKQLILTEKPSVALDFARALHFDHRTSCTYESKDYIITWAFGHLLELFYPEDYNPQWKVWKLATLPILPQEIQYRPIERTKKHLEQVVKIIHRQDIGHIIVATDAGREGELIARLLLTYAKVTNRPVFRFWTGLALTPDVIHRTLRELKPWKDFQHLYYAGKARQIADWLVGINLTRAATLALGDLYSVGRVQTAVLSLLVDRKKERDHFQPVPYFQLEASFSNPKGSWRGIFFQPEKKEHPYRLPTREKAEKIAKGMSLGDLGQVHSVKVTPKSTPPPQLYSLTELQRDANTQFHFTAQQTLTYAQSLYEKRKCLSYPRTDSRVLGKDNFPLVQKLLEQFGKTDPQLFAGIDHQLVTPTYLRVFNDEKVSDHHALIPLKPFPEIRGGGKEAREMEDERKVFQLVLKRLAEAFHPPCSSQLTEVITVIHNLQFISKGTVILVPGWTKIAQAPKLSKDEDHSPILPPLQKNDPADLQEKKIEERTTYPPPEYTENTLLGHMQNPSSQVKEKELRSLFRGTVGLGTESTRAQIIETLIDRHYVSREKRQLLATAKGKALIDYIRQLKSSQVLCTPEETARWEQKLQNISQGKMNPLVFVEEMKKFVQESLREFQQKAPPAQNWSKRSSLSPAASPSASASANSPTLGPCPACGKKVFEEKFYYECSGRREQKCTFSVKKIIAGKTITLVQVKRLLKTGLSPLIKGLQGKSGKKFQAKLKLVAESSGQVSTRFQFLPDSPKASTRETSPNN